MIHIPDSYPRFTYQIRIQDSHTGFVSKLMPSSMNECMLGGAMQGFFSVADVGCPSRGPVRGLLSGASARCPSGALCRVSFRGKM